MLLSEKVAVIYGAGGAIGGAVARAFAAEGAQVFPTGREVDAIGIPDSTIVGVPLVELDAERFAAPITAYATSYFLTARLAARRMIAQGRG
jgi:NAD(P)-dependent dehydrogenase (short-subunit alcohol dehydrogenase family)